MKATTGTNDTIALTAFDHLINELAKELRPKVTEIENGPEITQHHYGSYMSLLSTIAKTTRDGKLYTMALMKAGANADGLRAAYKFLFEG